VPQHTSGHSAVQQIAVPNASQQRSYPTVQHAPPVRRAANAAEVPDKQPLPPSTSQRVKPASENWFNTSVPVTQPAQPTEPTSGPTETGPTKHRPTKRSKKSNAGQHSSYTEHAGIVVEPNGDPFVVLNPPRSNTKGRKKS
jgi:hypothetical protein